VHFFVSGLIERYYCIGGEEGFVLSIAHSVLLHLWGLKGLDSGYGRTVIVCMWGGGSFFTSSGVCEGGWIRSRYILLPQMEGNDIFPQ
jgi:hypothetical protein